MPALRLLIFNRKYDCKYDHHFTAQHSVLSDAESMQLLMGVCHSLRVMLLKLSPGGECAFTYRTDKYRLYYQEVGGWRLVLLLSGGNSTSSCVYNGMTVTLETALRVFYATVFLEWVIKNPLVQPHSSELLGPGGFQSKLQEYFVLPIFT